MLNSDLKAKIRDFIVQNALPIAQTSGHLESRKDLGAALLDAISRSDEFAGTNVSKMTPGQFQRHVGTYLQDHPAEAEIIDSELQARSIRGEHKQVAGQLPAFRVTLRNDPGTDVGSVLKQEREKIGQPKLRRLGEGHRVGMGSRKPRPGGNDGR